ncbi:hypothetical protein NCLIV_038690 [Neospora caninum Liverpool]|uniref:Uncharacterized protein n=1 Tax=Neospora caninum (strain Liverpool) TaxID=572307 RepID=F0VAN9_NEOCL|nr:hypothetical protein NCLIV_038690 [Neospora caninum Liverpool]CBZ50794.1 hypothetical protein NCLIV_038690 [Neospora caninum Liverpool]CEL68095.1 TPA: hypothetical protein BN1204_038690 [Neospora caninum Liverpool]|eukprot:XP_003880827.1 hypothetical protein NCLIV_038690 [Neospora caninum Liverpool]
MKLFGIGIVTAGGSSLVRADLPIHGLMHDVLGAWTFTIGTDASDHPTSCGSGAPNFNLENLRPELSNYASWLASQSHVEKEIELTLTDKQIRKNSDVTPRNNWTYLAVTLPSTPDVPVGTWTMVYDEGFEKRFEILFNKLFPGESMAVFESPLSAQSILSCSHGCLRYAKDYNYVGGFYEGCNEEKIMNEVYHHGPVVVAIDAPDTLFMYQSGLFDSRPPDHGKICDIRNQGFNGWEYTNHAVAIVGWGEDE